MPFHTRAHSALQLQYKICKCYRYIESSITCSSLTCTTCMQGTHKGTCMHVCVRAHTHTHTHTHIIHTHSHSHQSVPCWKKMGFECWSRGKGWIRPSDFFTVSQYSICNSIYVYIYITSICILVASGLNHGQEKDCSVGSKLSCILVASGLSHGQ